jgi:hypothetical protein
LAAEVNGSGLRCRRRRWINFDRDGDNGGRRVMAEDGCRQRRQ